MDLGASVRKLAVGTVAISSFLLAGGAVPSAAQSADKPNIVMLMTDDTGWADFGAYGGGKSLGHATPNVDRVARKARSSPAGTARRVAPRAAPRS